jgi:hypothetical protein
MIGAHREERNARRYGALSDVVVGFRLARLGLRYRTLAAAVSDTREMR